MYKRQGRYVYIWTTTPTSSRTTILPPLESYGLHVQKPKMNEAFVKVSSNGTFRFRIQNPSIYKSSLQSHKVYPPHIHYKIATKDGTQFTRDFYTMTYLSDITVRETLRELTKGYTVVLNALPSEYYAKYNIPGSYNLPVKTATKMTQQEMDQFMKDILVNYPKLQKMVQEKKLKLHHIPIITYCAHAKCSAANMLSNELLTRNFINVVHYADGINGYYQKKYGVTIF